MSNSGNLNQNMMSMTSAKLHILAMGLMLCDHMWATLLPAQEWMNCVGRIAFPIFAFMAVEGYFHTHDLRRYILRLLICAVVSEIPFNMMTGENLLYPYHQNILWTLLLGLLLIAAAEKARTRGRIAWLAVSGAAVLLGYVIGYLTMVDYYGEGILTILVFYFFRERNWQCLLWQILCLYILHVELLGGYCYEFVLFGHEFTLVQQGLALLALIPIWLYRGEQGYHNKGFQLFCYAFYPLHITILVILRGILLA